MEIWVPFGTRLQNSTFIEENWVEIVCKMHWERSGFFFFGLEIPISFFWNRISKNYWNVLKLKIGRVSHNFFHQTMSVKIKYEWRIEVNEGGE